VGREGIRAQERQVLDGLGVWHVCLHVLCAWCKVGENRFQGIGSIAAVGRHTAKALSKRPLLLGSLDAARKKAAATPISYTATSVPQLAADIQGGWVRVGKKNFGVGEGQWVVSIEAV
jgi:hypothetical protein